MLATTLGVMSQQRKSRASLMREWSHYREHEIPQAFSISEDKKDVLVPISASGLPYTGVSFAYDCQSLADKGLLAAQNHAEFVGGASIGPVSQLNQHFNPAGWLFDGQIGSFIRIPNMGQFGTSYFGSMIINFYIDAFPANGTCLFSWGNPSFGGLKITFEADHRMYFYAYAPGSRYNYSYTRGRVRLGWNTYMFGYTGDGNSQYLNGCEGIESGAWNSSPLRGNFSGDLHVGADNLGQNPFTGAISEMIFLASNWVSTAHPRTGVPIKWSDFSVTDRTAPSILHVDNYPADYGFNRNPSTGVVSLPYYNPNEGVQFNLYPRLPSAGEDWSFETQIDWVSSYSNFFFRIYNQMGAYFDIGLTGSIFGCRVGSPGNWFKSDTLDSFGNAWNRSPSGINSQVTFRMTRVTNAIKCEMISNGITHTRYVEFQSGIQWNPTYMRFYRDGSSSLRAVNFQVNGAEGYFNTYYGSQPIWRAFELSQWAYVRDLQKWSFIAPYVKSEENLAWDERQSYYEDGGFQNGVLMNANGYAGSDLGSPNGWFSAPMYCDGSPTYPYMNLKKSKWTYEVELNPVSLNPDYSLIHSRSGAWTVYLDETGKVKFYVNGIGYVHTSVGSVTPASWTHIAIVRDGTALRFYINGAKDSEIVWAGTIPNGATGAEGFLTGCGGWSSYSSRYYGRLRWVRIVEDVALYSGDTIDYTTWRTHLPGADIRVTNEEETQVFQSAEVVPFDPVYGRYALLVKVPTLRHDGPTKIRVHFGNGAASAKEDLTFKNSDLMVLLATKRGWKNFVTKEHLSVGGTDGRTSSEVLGSQTLFRKVSMDTAVRRRYFTLPSDFAETDDATIVFFGNNVNDMLGKGIAEGNLWYFNFSTGPQFYSKGALVINRSGLSTPNSVGAGIKKTGTLWSWLQGGYEDAALSSSANIAPTVNPLYLGNGSNGCAIAAVIVSKRAMEYWEYESFYKLLYDSAAACPVVSKLKPHIEKIYPSVRPI